MTLTSVWRVKAKALSSEPTDRAPQRVVAGTTHPLVDVAGTRALEAALQATLPAHTLMQRAGAAVARLTLALAPHAHNIWLACGPGNNGGDGLEAAAQLQRLGKTAHVSWLGSPDTASADTRASWACAVESGVQWVQDCPSQAQFHIDALLGIGGVLRPPQGRMLDLLRQLRSHRDTTLAIDVPTGLDADNGNVVDLETSVRAAHCLTLLTLKPGLFTGNGRDMATTVWLHDLGLDTLGHEILLQHRCAELLGARRCARAHASHKGSYGDAVILGGAAGMSGAALLAGRAALHAGAGRVYVALSDGALPLDPAQPDLMLRLPPDGLRGACAVVGCGGGDTTAAVLPDALAQAAQLVLDADALNAIAADRGLNRLLQHRTARKPDCTVLTPHPLEAARLLSISVAEVQRDRCAAARTLACQTGCTVILKGSGSVVASMTGRIGINPTGNPRLAIAGTGDVLAGMVGAAMAQGLDSWDAACWACYEHGATADRWSPNKSLTASTLAESCRPLHAQHAS